MRSMSFMVMAVTFAVNALPSLVPEASAGIVICQRKNTAILRLDACKKKEQQVTLGADSVPNALNAQNAQNAANAQNALNAQTADNALKLAGSDPVAFEPALTHVPLTEIASGEEKVVGTVGPFQVLLSCNAGGTAGSAGLGIRNVGESHALAHSSDDDDDDFNPGDTIYFDYDDAGDAGFAVAPSGWGVQVGGLGGTADAAARPVIANNKCLAWATYFTIAHP